MQRADHTNKKRIIFSRWSRKNYAIFASLNRVVNIARLSVDICVTSLLKTNTLISSLRGEGIDSDYREGDHTFEELQEDQLFSQLLPVVVINPDITPKQEIIHLTIPESPYFASCKIWAFCF